MTIQTEDGSLPDEELWCVACPVDPSKPDDRTAWIPARNLHHAEALAARLGGEVQPWRQNPALHEAFLRGMARVLR